MRKPVVLGVVLTSGIAVFFFWWQVSLRPVNPQDTSVKTIVVSKGEGVRETARKLSAAGLIRSKIVFFLLIKELGIEKKIQAGSYKLSPSLGAEAIATRLTLGTEDKWVTIVEGLRSEEILELLERVLVEELDCPKESLCGQLKAGQKEELLADWKKDEGKLFPDTYLVPRQITASAFKTLLTKNFEKKFSSEMRGDLRKNGLIEEKTIILASLLEREARSDADRAKVADVLLKRLKMGMALDVDATVQYALGKQPEGTWWKKELTPEDLKVDSPYNTYLNPGLPPAPICNPGLSSLKAVVYPEANPYYFYVSDKKGIIHFAKTLEEHQQNVAKYL